MKNDPLVTVIIPVFNCEKYIRESIECALAQTYSNIEIIAVDDGSTDNSLRVLESFGGKITIIRQKNSGSAVARNAGIEAAAGKYVAFLDGDDYWFSEKVSEQVKYLATHPTVRLVFCEWIEWKYSVDKDSPKPKRPSYGDLQKIQPELSGDLYKELLLECILHTSTVVMHTELARDIGGFNPGFKKGQDYEFWLRVSRETEIHKLSAVLSLYRIHEESITSSPPSINYEFRVVKNALDLWGLSGFSGACARKRDVRAHLSKTWLNFGGALLGNGQTEHARSAFIKAIYYKPSSPRLWALLGVSIYKSIAS